MKNNLKNNNSVIKQINGFHISTNGKKRELNKNNENTRVNEDIPKIF